VKGTLTNSAREEEKIEKGKNWLLAWFAAPSSSGRAGDYHRLFAAHLPSLAQRCLQQGPETSAPLSLCLRLDLASHHRRGVTWPHLCLDLGLGRRTASPTSRADQAWLRPPLASATWHIKSATASSSSTALEKPSRWMVGRTKGEDGSDGGDLWGTMVEEEETGSCYLRLILHWNRHRPRQPIVHTTSTTCEETVPI
jgi:hypothetical protein